MPFTAEDWDAAVSWEDYLAAVEEKADVWRSAWRRAAITDADRQRLESLPGPRRVLVLSEDWCGDAARSVPVIVRAVRAAPGCELRVIDIESRPGLMEAHLSRNARAIPVAVVQDADGNDLGWWGPRPAALQTILREKLAAEGSPAKEDVATFYAPIMRWYRQDDGRTVLDEILLLLERGAS
jgi:hypothetical protein